MFTSTWNYEIIIQLPLIFTKLCHIKRDHNSEFLHFTENAKNCDILNNMPDPHKSWLDYAEGISKGHDC